MLGLTAGWWAFGQAAEVGVHFVFGEVEVFRPELGRWEFARPGMVLSDQAWVRMPPVALLRLRPASQAPLPLVNGPREARVDALLQWARAAEVPVGSALPADQLPLSDVLPLGAAPNSDSTEEKTLRLTPEEARRWMALKPAPKIPSPLRERLNAAGTVGEYPPPVLAQAQLLWLAAQEWSGSEGRLPDESVSRSGDTPVVLFSFTELLLAAEVPLQRVLRDGKPILLIDTAVRWSERRRVSANPRLVVPQDDRVWIPLAADRKPFVENWYRGALFWAENGGH